MQYEAILLEQKNKFITGDDIFLTFAIRDSNGTYLTDLSSFTFKGKLYSSADSLEMSGVTYFSTSGGKLILHIPHSNTISLEDSLKYFLELQGTKDTYIYTLCRIELWFTEEIVD